MFDASTSTFSLISPIENLTVKIFSNQYNPFGDVDAEEVIKNMHAFQTQTSKSFVGTILAKHEVYLTTPLTECRLTDRTAFNAPLQQEYKLNPDDLTNTTCTLIMRPKINTVCKNVGMVFKCIDRAAQDFVNTNKQQLIRTVTEHAATMKINVRLIDVDFKPIMNNNYSENYIKCPFSRNTKIVRITKRKSSSKKVNVPKKKKKSNAAAADKQENAAAAAAAAATSDNNDDNDEDDDEDDDDDNEKEEEVINEKDLHYKLINSVVRVASSQNVVMMLRLNGIYLTINLQEHKLVCKPMLEILQLNFAPDIAIPKLIYRVNIQIGRSSQGVEANDDDTAAAIEPDYAYRQYLEDNVDDDDVAAAAAADADAEAANKM